MVLEWFDKTYAQVAASRGDGRWRCIFGRIAEATGRSPYHCASWYLPAMLLVSLMILGSDMPDLTCKSIVTLKHNPYRIDGDELDF
jgi:hypothetical protein